jgi:nucleoside-diphosphate kinase
VEQTLLIINPDTVKRGLVGCILQRIEAKGLKLASMRLMYFSREMVHAIYAGHQGKDFRRDLELSTHADFLCSGPAVVVVISGDDAAAEAKRLVDTIRGDFAIIGSNICHISDNTESAQRELEAIRAHRVV